MIGDLSAVSPKEQTAESSLELRFTALPEPPSPKPKAADGAQGSGAALQAVR